MNIQTKKEPNAVVVTISGRLDAVTAPEYEKKIHELIGGAENSFIIDFEPLDYISSAGLRVLLSTTKFLKSKGGQISFAHISGPVKEVFDISGFNSIFQVHDSVSTALAKLL